ncbi:MAG: hypothetical protein JJLCMIEE_02555 [Acidimicrobiales bacterium]|nr:hypothetical protein [Acidimicrobiales bacterium]
MSIITRILGPKVDKEELTEHQGRYRKPKLLFTVAALVLGISILFPYWQLKLEAPQFPDGLDVNAYVNRLEGDVQELEGLNHYVGIPSFDSGAVLERSVSVAGILVLAGLLLAALYIHSRWVLVLALPALVFPFFFMADMQYWLWNYGHSLDPVAPLSSAVGEFTPPLFGPGEIAQFDTLAWPGPGLILALAAAILTGIGLWYHRKAYKPLVEEMFAREARRAEQVEAAGEPAATDSVDTDEPHERRRGQLVDEGQPAAVDRSPR